MFWTAVNCLLWCYASNLTWFKLRRVKICREWMTLWETKIASVNKRLELFMVWFSEGKIAGLGLGRYEWVMVWGVRIQLYLILTPKCLIGMFGILSISGQNRHLSTEHDQNSFAGASSTYYRGLVHQRGHPHGKMGK